MIMKEIQTTQVQKCRSTGVVVQMRWFRLGAEYAQEQESWCRWSRCRCSCAREVMQRQR